MQHAGEREAGVVAVPLGARGANQCAPPDKFGHLRPDHAPRTRSRREVRWQAASRQSTVGQEIGEGASYAIRTGGYLEWDGIAGHFTNNPDANLLLKANYQNGWTFGT
jgi:hypothetical protein